MVVKLLEAEDLALLEERINMFIVDKDKEKREMREYAKYIPYDFKVDIKVVPGYMVDIGGARNMTHDAYFIAVIQY